MKSKIVLISPAATEANNGNWHTVYRWAKFLSDHCDIAISQIWDSEDIDAEADKALLRDPQTFGGLLVSCRPDVAAQVLEIFHTQGFADAALIGEVVADSGCQHLLNKAL